MTMIVDSHCHLNYGSLTEDMDGVLERAKEAGVGTMLAINARLKEFDEVRLIAEAHDHIWATVGSHPHDAEDEWGITPEELIEKAKHPKVVGIGETGLDYFYEHAPRDKQKQNFIAHIEAS
ncbi:MAG: TatD family hydrolase, partial [Emcibacteraceae bacterium]|nr:TatD family hydrolase [Emcibacteraceae bacterium]